jgi:hypothetical protein
VTTTTVSLTANGTTQDIAVLNGNVNLTTLLANHQIDYTHS